MSELWHIVRNALTNIILKLKKFLLKNINYIRDIITPRTLDPPIGFLPLQAPIIVIFQMGLH